MDCPIHGCEMVVVKLGAGWGSEPVRECPQCKEEQGRAKGSGKSQVVFSAGNGWSR